MIKYIFAAGVGVFSLGKRLGCLEPELPTECREWMWAWHNMLASGHRLIMGVPFYKLWPTKDWKTLKLSITRMFELAMR